MRLIGPIIAVIQLIFVDSFQSLFVSKVKSCTTSTRKIVAYMEVAGAKETVSMTARKGRTALFMCICIHCARVTNCAAYHFVETKHDQPHMADNPTFQPRSGSPTIHANIRTLPQNEELGRLYRDYKVEEQEATSSRTEDDGENVSVRLHGKTVYDLSTSTTIEYDVVACEDFIEDWGCW